MEIHQCHRKTTYSDTIWPSTSLPSSFSPYDLSIFVLDMGAVLSVCLSFQAAASSNWGRTRFLSWSQHPASFSLEMHTQCTKYNCLGTAYCMVACFSGSEVHGQYTRYFNYIAGYHDVSRDIKYEHKMRKLKPSLPLYNITILLAKLIGFASIVDT